MWEKILQFGQDLLNLKKQTADNTSEIKEIRQELKELTEAVTDLANAVKRDRDRNADREEVVLEKVKNMVLQLENSILRSKLSNGNDKKKIEDSKEEE